MLRISRLVDLQWIRTVIMDTDDPIETGLRAAVQPRMEEGILAIGYQKVASVSDSFLF